MSERQQEPEQPDRTGRARDARTGDDAAANRIRHQHRWVDLQIQEAMRRGEFDDLPGAGRPIRNLGAQHDPDWWIKQLIERERITGVLPPALQLRKDDAELDAHLDTFNVERDARRELEEFNARVIKARYTPVDGPPLITQPRDVEAELEAWRARRDARLARRPAAPGPDVRTPERRRRGWFRRAMRHTDP